MKFLENYKLHLSFVAAAGFLGVSLYLNENKENTSVWSPSKESLSVIEQADSLNPRAYDLKESPFADSLAQKAFEDEQTPPPVGEKSSDDSSGSDDFPSSEPDRDTTDPYAKAEEMLGKPKASESQNENDKPTGGKSPFTKTGMWEKNSKNKSTVEVTRTKGNEIKDAEPKIQRRFSTTPSNNTLLATRGDDEVQGALSSGGDLHVVGKGNTNLTGGNLLKQGSEYIAVIKDTIELTGSEKQNVVIHVFGALSDNATTKPFRMFAEAKLARNGQSISINVISCIDARPNTRSIKCKGEVGGIDGRRGLSDEVYSPDTLAAMMRSIGLLGSQWSLANLTESITETGVLVDQSRSNQIWQTMSGTWFQLGEQLAQNIEKHGNTVTLYGHKVVKILIIEDVELW